MPEWIGIFSGHIGNAFAQNGGFGAGYPADPLNNDDQIVLYQADQPNVVVPVIETTYWPANTMSADSARSVDQH